MGGGGSDGRSEDRGGQDYLSRRSFWTQRSTLLGFNWNNKWI